MKAKKSKSPDLVLRAEFVKRIQKSEQLKGIPFTSTEELRKRYLSSKRRINMTKNEIHD